MHTNFNLETSHDSGQNSIEEMGAKAKTLGYEYIAITNHNPSTKVSVLDKVIAQQKKVEHINLTTKSVRVLSLLEVDISPSGTLPLPQNALDLLDGCLVSIHSNFNLSKEAMTTRVLTGLANPAARIFAHPTGRLLGEREGYELDWPKIFEFCLKHDKALEINCSPQRLDLPDTLVREAVKFGVKLSLGTDAHNIDGMDMMPYGVSVARRGWAEAKNIINTWEYNKLVTWFRKRG